MFCWHSWIYLQQKFKKIFRNASDFLRASRCMIASEFKTTFLSLSLSMHVAKRKLFDNNKALFKIYLTLEITPFYKFLLHLSCEYLRFCVYACWLYVSSNIHCKGFCNDESTLVTMLQKSKYCSYWKFELQLFRDFHTEMYREISLSLDYVHHC